MNRACTILAYFMLIVECVARKRTIIDFKRLLGLVGGDLLE